MEPELYKVSLNPAPGGESGASVYMTSPGGSEPGTATPTTVPVVAGAGTGSIGGSDVGANTADDQRVRDLIEQYLRDHNTLDTLNRSLIINNPLIAVAEGGWYSATGIGVMQNFNEVANTFGQFSSLTHTIVTDGYPVIVHFASFVSLTYVANAIQLSSDSELSCFLYIDNTFVTEATFYHTIDHTANQQYVLKTTLSHLVAVNTPALIIKGAHKYRLDFFWSEVAKNDNSVYFFGNSEALTVVSDPGKKIVIS